MNDDPEILLRNFREKLPMLLQYAVIMAQAHRAKYNACLKEGFTEAQALELCKTIP